MWRKRNGVPFLRFALVSLLVDAAKGLIGIARSTRRKDTNAGGAGASRPCQLGNRSRHMVDVRRATAPLSRAEKDAKWQIRQ